MLPPRPGHPATRPPPNRVSAFSPAKKAPTHSLGEQPVQGPPGRGPVIPCRDRQTPAFPPNPAGRGLRLKSVACGLPGSLGRSPGPVRAVRRFLGKPARPAPAGAGGGTSRPPLNAPASCGPWTGPPTQKAGRFGRPAIVCFGQPAWLSPTGRLGRRIGTHRWSPACHRPCHIDRTQTAVSKAFPSNPLAQQFDRGAFVPPVAAISCTIFQRCL